MKQLSAFLAFALSMVAPLNAASAEGYYFRAKPLVTATAEAPDLPAALAVSASDLGTQQIGMPFTGSLTATGGTAPYTWTAASLPTGLTLSSSGALSGTLFSAPGTQQFNVTARDSTGATASAQISIVGSGNGAIYATGYGPVLGAVADAGGYVKTFKPAGAGFVKLFGEGYDHACGLTAANDLYCWGGNTYGQLGTGGTVRSASPTLVLTSVKEAKLGYQGTCAIKTNDTLWCWGDNGIKQISASLGAKVLAPAQIASGIRSVSVNNNLICSVTTGGSMSCAGEVPNYAKGYGTGWDRVETNNNGFDACALKTNGSLWCWGDNAGGTGTGSNSTVTTPTQISSAVHTAITFGANAACSIRSGGTLWCWGYNYHGTVGIGSTTARIQTPTQVSGAWTWVQAGMDQMCAGKADGSMWCWGTTSGYQLGRPTTANVTSPVKIADQGVSPALGYGSSLYIAP